MTKTFDLGSVKGADGVSPIITGSKTAGVTTLTIVDADHPSPGTTLATINDGTDASIASTSAMLKGDGNGAAVAATAGTDYQAPMTAGTDYLEPPASANNGDVLTYNNGVWDAEAPTGGGGSIATTSGMLKGDNDGNAVAATAGTDYQAPLTAGTDYIAPPGSPSNGDVLTYSSGSWTAAAPTGGATVATTTGMLKGDNAGNAIAATAGTDYQAPLVAGTDYQTPLAETAKVWYGYCETAASTATKTVTITGITALTEGLNVRIRFKYGYSSNSTPQLKINSLDTKNIYYADYAAPLSSAWAAGAVLDLLYDGTQFKIVGQARGDTSLYGIVKLSDSTSSSSSQIAATSKAVKAAYDLADAAIPAPSSASQGDYLKYDGNDWVAGAGGGGGGGSIATTTSVLKGDGTGGAVAATAGTDFQAPLTAGTDYIAPPSSPSSGDVLTYSGSAWAASAPAKEVYWCTYGTTTNAQIETALSAGQTPCCIYSSKLYVYAYKSSTTNHSFVCNYGDTQYQIKNNNGVWSTTNYTWQKQITASGLLKGAGSGTVSAATAGTDYQAPLTAGTDYIAPPASPSNGDVLTWSGSAWAASAVPTEIPTQTGNSGKFLTTNGTAVSWASVSSGGSIPTTTALLKGDNAGNATAATAGTDYQAPLTAGTDYATPTNITDKINRTTDVDAADTNYTTYMARGESLNSLDTTPTANGTIAWKYE